MKQYKPLLSSAPANSILNAQQFHYTNSASTDIRKTFANFRRNASRQNQLSVETRLLADDIANGSSNTYAVERWYMLAAALIVG